MTVSGAELLKKLSEKLEVLAQLTPEFETVKIATEETQKKVIDIVSRDLFADISEEDLSKYQHITQTKSNNDD